MTHLEPIRALRAWLASAARARDTRLALQALDRRALRDLGLDHSEITSIAATAAGRAVDDRRSRIETLV